METELLRFNYMKDEKALELHTEFFKAYGQSGKVIEIFGKKCRIYSLRESTSGNGTITLEVELASVY